MVERVHGSVGIANPTFTHSVHMTRGYDLKVSSED